jgi:hypothetical protein
LIGAIYLVETPMLEGLFSWQSQKNALSIKNGRATPKRYRQRHTPPGISLMSCTWYYLPIHSI